jgi:hypothetical protein
MPQWKKHLAVLGLALIASNFIWAAVFSHDWAAALERSYFQTWALVLAGYLRLREAK